MTDEEKEFLKQHRVINISNETDYPPFDFTIGNEPAGYSIDLLQLIEKKIGVKFNYINGYTWDELWKKFENKEIDITHPVARNQYREKYGRYTQRLYSGKYVFITKSQTPKINSVEALKDKVVASPKSWAKTVYMQEHHPQITLLLTDTDQEAKQAVREGKAYAMVGNDAVTYYQLKKQMDTDLKVNALFHEYNNGRDNDLFFLIRKDWPLLHKIFEKAMESISIAEHEELQNKWFGKNENDTSKIRLNKQELEYLHAHPVILVGNEEDYPPFDFAVEGKPLGYSVELLQRLAQKIGIELKFINGYTWKQLLSMFQNEKLDVLLTAATTPARDKYALYTQSYYDNKNYVYLKKGSQIKSMKDLNGKVVAVGAGYAQEDFLALHYPKIKLLSVNNVEQMIEAVLNEKADALIEGSDTINYFLTVKRMKGLTRSIWFKDYDTSYNREFHYMIQKDAKPLQSMFNKAMDSLAPGELKALQQKWLELDLKQNTTLELSSVEENYLKRLEKLTMCIDPDWMPFDGFDENGMHQGIGLDYKNIIAQKLGKSIEVLKTNSWNESLLKAKLKECDLISLSKKTPSRSKYLLYSKPLLSVPYVVATKDTEFFIDDFSAISNKKFSAIAGSSIVEELELQYPNIKISEVRNIQRGLEKVQQGEVYGYIDATAAIKYAVEKYNIHGVKIVGKLANEYRLSIGVRNDEMILFNIIQKALRDISFNEHQRVQKKWMAINQERVTDYNLVFQVITVAVLILALFVYWNRRLSKTKKELILAKDKLETLVVTDKLTNVYNRRKLDEMLQREIDRSERFGHSFAIAFLDIDHFKVVNDRYGHQIGDMVLIEIANILLENSRKTDIVGRWGGEEFLMIFPESTQESVEVVVEKIREAIQNKHFDTIGTVTASFGVTGYDQGDTVQTMFKKADDALYEAKEGGRNQVVYLSNL